MANIDQPVSISADELDEVLARARAEDWRELAIFGPDTPLYKLRRVHDERAVSNEFQLAESVEGLAAKLAALTGLTSLNLWRNSIGADGVRALAALTGLTWLDLVVPI